VPATATGYVPSLTAARMSGDGLIAASRIGGLNGRMSTDTAAWNPVAIASSAQVWRSTEEGRVAARTGSF
jgi:hypothetical protein